MKKMWGAGIASLERLRPGMAEAELPGMALLRLARGNTSSAQRSTELKRPLRKKKANRVEAEPL